MSRVDNAARGLLHRLGLTEPPIDVFWIAKQLDVSVVESSMPSDVSGMLIREGGERTVGLNSAQHPRRQRFTLAHEIGHLELHRGRPLIVDSAVRVNLRDARSARATDREEMEANRFAAALLMPDFMVVAAVDEADTSDVASVQERLAKMFKVSSEAMGYRLVNLGITS